MRVLLTGATGFVGSHLLERLLRDGEHTAAIVLRNVRPPWRIAHLLDRVAVVAGDLARPAELVDSVRRFGPEVVLHVAWEQSVDRECSPIRQVDNVGTTTELVKLAHASGARHFIGLGSQAEYGPCPHRIDEAVPPRPITLYGTAKLCAGLLAERMCAELGLRFAWIRLFSAYGPRDAPTYLIPSLCRSLLRGERPTTTHGEQLWDYLYVEDAAEAIQRVALQSDAAGVFNLGSGRVVTIRSVVERLRDLIRPGAEIGFGEVPYRENQIMHLEANVDRLRQISGWEPVTGLDAGLRRTVEWFRKGGEAS
jgi:UDP-glucose 4-epimerase